MKIRHIVAGTLLATSMLGGTVNAEPEPDPPATNQATESSSAAYYGCSTNRCAFRAIRTWRSQSSRSVRRSDHLWDLGFSNLGVYRILTGYFLPGGGGSPAVMTYETTTTVSENLEVTDAKTPGAVDVDGTYVVLENASLQSNCGSVHREHQGSAFSRRTASLHITTYLCWTSDGRYLLNTPRVSHYRSVSFYGSTFGWRVGESYNGSSGWLDANNRWQSEVKAG